MNYKYIILNSPRSSDVENKYYYNCLFDNWKSLWQSVFDKVGRKDDLNVDDFFKQDFIVAVFDGKKPVAMHMYSCYDLALRACKEQSYFSSLPVEAFKFFENNKIRKVMTMEYLTVFPEYRKSESGLKWGEIMISLGTRLLKYTTSDFAIGTARTDVKVNNMAMLCNFQSAFIDIKKYDYNCEVIYYNKEWTVDHKNIEYRNLINGIWNDRLDYSNVTNSNLNMIKKAS